MLALLVATEITLQDTLKYVSQIGVLGLLIIVLYGGYKRLWVWGWLYREQEARINKLERERDDWRDIALHGTTLAEATVDLFHRSRSQT